MTTTDDVRDVLADVKVLEMATLDRVGIPRTRPMASAWLPDQGRIVITTPLAYPQKAFDLRRDGRIALLYSDFTGSGLSGRPGVLVRGTATVPGLGVAPQDLPEYWRELFRKSPGLADGLSTDTVRSTMDWYYWRLPIVVTPNSVEEVECVPGGGDVGSRPPHGASLAEQVADALTRYPSAVLTARDADGAPVPVRVPVTAGTGDTLTIETPPGFDGGAGPASLLWHLHDGVPAVVFSLQVAGILRGDGRRWTFDPARIPGAPAREGVDSAETWAAAGRTRTRHYLDRHGLDPAPIDWDALARLAPVDRDP